MLNAMIQGAFSVPGTVSAAAIRAPLPTSSPAAPLGAPATSAPMHRAAHALLPLVYWYGHASTRRNPLLLDRIIRNLGENINDRWDVDPDGESLSILDQRMVLFQGCVLGRVAGVIVDTPSSFATGKSGPGGKGEHSQMLIKACIDGFRSERFVPSASFSRRLTRYYSKHNPRRGARKTESRDGENVWFSPRHGSRQDTEVGRCKPPYSVSLDPSRVFSHPML